MSIHMQEASLVSLPPLTSASAVELALRADPGLETLSRNPHLGEISSLTVGEFAEAIAAQRRSSARRLRPLPGAASEGDMRSRLSTRELQVVNLLVEGLSNKQISRRLALSDKTVKNHVSHILAKLKLSARTQVAVMALRGGIA